MIQVEERKNVKEVTDDMNPRIYKKYFRCAECAEWIDEEETVWVKDSAYHVECAPNQY